MPSLSSEIGPQPLWFQSALLSVAHFRYTHLWLGGLLSIHDIARHPQATFALTLFVALG